MDNFYVTNTNDNSISIVQTSNPSNVTTWVTGFPLNGPQSMAWDPSYVWLYVSNYAGNNIVAILPNGTMCNWQTITGPAALGEL
jgi:DNA-binding beta-propeller fold protein YncE